MSSAKLSYEFTKGLNECSHEIQLALPEVFDPQTISIQFRHTGAGAGQPLVLLDGMVCAVIFYCMSQKLDLHVRGELSSVFLRRIRLFMESWNRWFPDLYSVIDVSCDSIYSYRSEVGEDTSSTRLRKESTVTPLSGGVDSTFSLLRNSGSGSKSNFTISQGVFVQGFDIPSKDTIAASRASRKLKELAGLYEIAYSEVHTNLRDQIPLNWEHAHGAALASVLHLFSRESASGLIPSAQAVDGVLSPWGTHPATDNFLSGELMDIIHDGAGFGRFEKVRHLTMFPKIAKYLRVCWEGQDLSRNCSTCEKCLRTMASIEIAGGSPRRAFRSRVTSGRVSSLVFPNSRVRQQWVRILELAEQDGRRFPWITALRKRLDTN